MTDTVGAPTPTKKEMDHGEVTGILTINPEPSCSNQRTTVDSHEHLTRSPTDAMVSPVSRKLLSKSVRKNPGKSIASNLLRRYQVENEIRPTPVPTNIPIILGSSSSNRHRVLELLGWKFATMIPGIDEKAIRISDPKLLPVLIATAKAEAIFDRLKADYGSDSSKKMSFILLTADQIVLYKDEVREKPETKEEATNFLTSYSDTCVSTISAVVATHFPSGRQAHEVEVATVYWNTISPEVVRRVVDRGAIFTSSGGFRIDDEDLSPLINHMDGTIDSILGMPIDATLRIIDKVLFDA